MKDEIIGNVIKNNFARKSLRTILTAYRDIPFAEFDAFLASTEEKEINEKIKMFA